MKPPPLLVALTRWTVIVGFTGLLVMAALTMTDAVLRYLSAPRIPGFGDMGEVVFALVIASCFPAGLLREQNIQITLLVERLGPRSRAWAELLGAALTLVVFAFIAVQFVFMTADLQSAGRTTSTVRLPVAPWWWLTTLVMLSTLPVQGWITLERLRQALAGPKP